MQALKKKIFAVLLGLGSLSASFSQNLPKPEPTLLNRPAGKDLVAKCQNLAAHAKQFDYHLVNLYWLAGTENCRLYFENGASAFPAAQDQEYTFPNFFEGAEAGQAIGISLLVPGSHLPKINSTLPPDKSFSWDVLDDLIKQKLVHRMDVTRIQPPKLTPPVSVVNKKSGLDLEVQTKNVAAGYQVMNFKIDPQSSDKDEQRTCTVMPYKGKSFNAMSATSMLHADFFKGDPHPHQALSILVADSNVAKVEKLLARKTQFRCRVVESIARLGLIQALDRSKLEAAGLRDVVQTEITNLGQPVADGSDRDAVTKALINYYDRLITSLRLKVSSYPEAWNVINAAFIAKVDYRKLLQTHSFNSLARVDHIRGALDKADPSQTAGEQFILHLADQFIKLFPVAQDNLAGRVEIAQNYLSITKEVPYNYRGETHRIDREEVADYYNNIGRFLLVKCADFIRAGGHGLSAAEVDNYKGTFEKNEVYLDEKRSGLKKVWDNIRQGNFDYLSKRFMQALPGQTREYEKDEYVLSGLRTGLNQSNLDVYKIIGKKNGEVGTLLFCSNVSRSQKFGYVCKRTIGYDETQVLNRFGGQRMYFYTTGSYTTQDGRTSGLAAEAGEIKNYLITMKMDGLVVVKPGGGVDILNLDAGIILPKHTTPIRPSQSIPDFYELVRWLEENKYGCFQTHLLTWNGEFKIDPEKEIVQLRERRLLARLAGERIAIIDLPSRGGSGFTLSQAAIIAQKIFDHLAARLGTNVEGVVNMDVGAYDIFEVFDDNGTRVAGANSGKTAAQAINLLFLYK